MAERLIEIAVRLDVAEDVRTWLRGQRRADRLLPFQQALLAATEAALEAEEREPDHVEQAADSQLAQERGA
jgi:hypothetical protein